MTQAELFTLVGFIVVIIGTVTGAWWRVEGKVAEAKSEATTKADAAGAKADLVSAQLAEYKTHVAERYISKEGHRESTEQVMQAISAVKTAIDGTNQRIDRLFEPGKRRSE